jgi:hypothetical protein
MSDEKRGHKILEILLERLYAALSRGPALNCWPGRSRQRVDLSALELFGGASAPELLRALVEQGQAEIRPEIQKIPPPVRDNGPEDPELRRRRELMLNRSNLLKKLATLAEEARTYEQDTGAYILYLGYPLLSLTIPAPGGRLAPTRILSPLAFIPIELKVNRLTNPSVKIVSSFEGSDRVFANLALRTWLERQYNRPWPELFEDEEGTDPLREISEIVNHVADVMKLPHPFNVEDCRVDALPSSVDGLPKEAQLLPSAVLGLYPLTKQNTIMDMRELMEREKLPETVGPFLTLKDSLVSEVADEYADNDGPQKALLPAADEHLIAPADPCQRRAVITARDARGLVVHGPPGTGKSQTITNVIGDYLARGQRVLLVCEKRTALDVVRYRLEHAGLAHLCAVVHDATRDRESLYKGVRTQLDNLADAPQVDDPTPELARVNAELDRLNGELHEYFDALAEKDDSGFDFHELAGRWLETQTVLPRDASIEAPRDLATVPPSYVLQREGELRNTLERAEAANYAENSWVSTHSLTVDGFLSRSMPAIRQALAAALKTAQELGTHFTQERPPYDVQADLLAQAHARVAAGDELERLTTVAPQPLRAWLASQPAQEVKRLRDAASQVEPLVAMIAAQQLAPDLEMTWKMAPQPFPQVQQSIAALRNHLQQVQGLFGFFKFGAKKEARAVLTPFGLALDRENVTKLAAFLEGVRARMMVRMFLQEKLAPAGVAIAEGDGALVQQANALRDTLALLLGADETPELTPLAELLRKALPADADAREAARVLRGSMPEAEAILRALQALAATEMINGDALGRFRQKILYRRTIGQDVEKLIEDLPLLEPLLRFEFEVTEHPAPLAEALRRVVAAHSLPDTCWHMLLAALFHAAIGRQFERHPNLQRVDAARLNSAIRRIRELNGVKFSLEAARIRHQWQQTQRTRLLAMTGSRLNSNGADLRRRLTLRGKNASRIRQVVFQGREIEGGDPLFDIQPVWMASPEVVAQIFPQDQIFDVVIFDEASQCRLEEAIPVLTRGRSIVIAGDTKQLPPTRFFESGITSSRDEAADAEDADESMFISHQAEIEDLLSGALNIEIEQSFLDVHYRSSNAELIAFSNDAFYGDRLQPIPANPRNVAEIPPIRLHNVDGEYAERCNEEEAIYVVGLVKELLAQKNPPSIGIVSFNLTQRDLLVDKLDEEAERDKEFAKNLATARDRWGSGSFEGLFVKNLENVQGDERDIVIISTTFGVAPDGKFRRNFGPLSQAGGERRLNVLITRARDRVELVTSIPGTVYRIEPPIPEGQRPNGSWYLMRYLAYAERVRDAYAAHQDADAINVDEMEDDGEEEELTGATISTGGTGTHSRFAESLARYLAFHHDVSSMLFYGNEGFCMDVTLLGPHERRKTILGILCDAARYRRAQDRVEWDLFQLLVHESQRWELHRVWSPHFVRDPETAVKDILARMESLLKGEQEREQNQELSE